LLPGAIAGLGLFHRRPITVAARTIRGRIALRANQDSPPLARRGLVAIGRAGRFGRDGRGFGCSVGL
jgi:hypothetical protein